MAEFGWTYLSRKSLRQAEDQLSGDTQGVRDEIGFLLIHQHYANKFFPGTSVLQTRLRYVFFISWMYQVIAEFELKVCRKLKSVPNQRGVIGSRTYPKTITQPPSTIYWNAMGAWGLLLRNEDRRFIGKTQLRGLIQANRRTARNGDEFAIEMQALPFDTDIPPAPSDFDGSEPLSFALTPKEKQYLHVKLSHLARNGAKASLFEKLVSELRTNAIDIVSSESCWDSRILRLADNDRAELKIAERAAALVAISRGVYAALVEQLRNEDHKEDKGFHQAELDLAVAKYWTKAIELDLEDLKTEIPTLPIELLEVLKNTQAWLNKHKRNPADLYKVYEAAESGRKKLRARLPRTRNGRSRRDDWEAEIGSVEEQRTQTEPLHYRWYIVRNLLSDLHGELGGDR
jgi:hypothetical protein